MAKKALNLTIPTPCTENWNAMTPDPNGRFCASCQKTVIDFSSMSDAEIVQYFTHFKGVTCGRFTEKQLQRPLSMPTVSKPQNRWAWAFSALLLPTVLSSQTVKTVESVVFSTNSVVLPTVVELKKQGAEINHNEATIKLHGIVVDTQYQPIIGASIVLRGTNNGTVTDLDGHFELKVPAPTTDKQTIDIEVSFIGYESLSLKINPSDWDKDLNINLKESMMVLGEYMIMPRPNSFKLIKYRIKNLFRRN